jgi:hypothetical protein
MSDDFLKAMQAIEDLVKAQIEKDKEKPSRFQAIKYLWKTDDPDWLEQRENEWRMLVEDGYCADLSVKETKQWQDFYISGGEPADGKDAFTDSISGFFMMPFTTVDEVQAAYNIDRHPHSRQRILCGYMSYACQWGQRMPWLRERIKLFIDGVFGQEYKVIEAKDSRGDSQVISPDPTSFSTYFPIQVMKYFKRGQAYDDAVDRIPYLLSVLPHAVNPELRKQMWHRRKKRMELDMMFEEAERVLADEAEQRPLAKQLAKDLLELKDEIWTLWKLNEHLDQ